MKLNYPLPIFLPLYISRIHASLSPCTAVAIAAAVTATARIIVCVVIVVLVVLVVFVVNNLVFLRDRDDGGDVAAAAVPVVGDGGRGILE